MDFKFYGKGSCETLGNRLLFVFTELVRASEIEGSKKSNDNTNNGSRFIQPSGKEQSAS